MILREVRLLSLPMVVDLDAAHESVVAGHRELAVLRLVDTDSGHEGWGECAALNVPGYTAESARGAYRVLASGEPVDPREAPMVAAAVEMAELDLDLRRRREPLASWLGIPPAVVTAGATIGLGSVSAVAAKANELSAAGYRRLKLKITPAAGLDGVAAIRRDHSDLELQVDANGSFGIADMAELGRSDELGVTVVEQPLAPDDIDGFVVLRERLEAKILVDEGGRPEARLDRLLTAEAIDGVVVKPGCIGGIAAGVDLLDRCKATGIDASIGGMIESSLGRHSLAVLAAHEAATVVGDVSPSSLWLTADPWPDLTLVDGTVTASQRVGIADLPDAARLDAVTVEISQPTG